VRKLPPVGLLVFVLTLALAGRGFPELTEQQKRELFLRAREDIRPVPRATATPRPKPSPAPRSTPRPTPEQAPPPTPKPKATPKPTPVPVERAEEATPPEPEKPKREEEKPKPEPTPKEQPKPTATPKPTAKPKATPKPKPTARPDAPIVVEKSGKAEDEGLAPTPKKKGFSIFGGGPKYKYLTASVRAAIDNAKVKKGRWKYIIVHNSGTRQGNAKAFDNYHRNVRKMQNGLAYHFVIGNGTSSGNGEIEIGNRWVRQINGGHVASDYLNNIAIGICLVGDYNRDRPTETQLAALKELIQYLRQRCGKVKGKEITVRGHKQINPKPTDCPGNRFPLKWLNGEFKD